MMFVTFYANDDPAGLLIREATRRPGQPWEQVPSHCAALFIWDDLGGGTVFEYVVTGWNIRRDDARDGWRVPVPVSDVDASYDFACRAKGRYDWDGVLSWLINDHLPPGLRVSDQFPAHYDCSRFLLSVLLSGGWPCPSQLSVAEGPPSPNDIWLALQTLDNPADAGSGRSG